MDCCEVALAGSDLSGKDGLRTSPFGSVGNGDRVLVDIRPDEQRGIFAHG